MIHDSASPASVLNIRTVDFLRHSIPNEISVANAVCFAWRKKCRVNESDKKNVFCNRKRRIIQWRKIYQSKANVSYTLDIFFFDICGHTGTQNTDAEVSSDMRRKKNNEWKILNECKSAHKFPYTELQRVCASHLNG